MRRTATAAALQGLGIEPVGIEAVVPDYLVQYRPRGQFSVYPPEPQV